MTNYHKSLIEYVLSCYPQGLSKVRLAKILYLSHKRLCKLNLIQSEALKFTRLPLGPVPIFMEDLKNNNMIIIEHELTGLSYNRQVYRIKAAVPLTEGNIAIAIRDLNSKLKPFQTSQLVEYTHREPSWIKHTNGQEYFIEEDDLKRRLPAKHKHISAEADEQLLQALLVDGMLDEIVSDSTSLEYPTM